MHPIRTALRPAAIIAEEITGAAATIAAVVVALTEEAAVAADRAVVADSADR